MDPSDYEDPREAVREFARELDPTMLTSGDLIGGGKDKHYMVSRNKEQFS